MQALFKWEDSPALKHHCGVCQRPLLHPSAISSCYGPHAEPCHRFHQSLFMPHRGHLCAPCHKIDEEHHKRHKDSAEQLRTIYEAAGESQWPIIPPEVITPEVAPPENARLDSEACEQGDDLETALVSYSSTEPDLVPRAKRKQSKRERKAAKRLAKAAARTKIVTQKDIDYLNGVMHSSDIVTSPNGDDPRNVDDIESKDVDLDADMEHIQSVLRINELTKRNTPTGGLRGKELKSFDQLVGTFRTALIDDFVLVHKDNLEIRMRRAGYLRYVNKAAYTIVADRYAEMDWKQGGKIVPSSRTESPDSVQCGEASAPVNGNQKKKAPVLPPSVEDIDLRHFEHTHTRVTGDDGLDDPVIEPQDTPVLQSRGNLAPQNRIKSLRIVDIAPTNAMLERAGNAWGKRHCRTHSVTSEWETQSYERKSSASNSHGPWVDTWQLYKNGAGPSTRNSWMENDLEFPGLPSSRNPVEDSTFYKDSSTQYEPESPKVKDASTQTPCAVIMWLNEEPDDEPNDKPDVPVTVPAVELPHNEPGPSLKKQNAKKEREAKRKARKIAEKAEQAEHVNTTDSSNELPMKHQQSSNAVKALIQAKMFEDAKGIEGHNVVQKHNEQAEAENVEDDDEPQTEGEVANQQDEPQEETQAANSGVEPVSGSKEPSQPGLGASFPKPRVQKHMDWLNFTKYLIVDKLTLPYSLVCPFERHHIKDCPYHKDYADIDDPFSADNQVCLVYPALKLRRSGLYNMLQGARLLNCFEREPATAGKVMLLDWDVAELCNYDSTAISNSSFAETADKLTALSFAAQTHPRGERTHQYQQYAAMRAANAHQTNLPRDTLRDLERKFQPPGADTICYCKKPVPPTMCKDEIPLAKTADPNLLLLCWYKGCETVHFHWSCAEDLGVELVTRWYCTSCELKMGEEARRVIGDIL